MATYVLVYKGGGAMPATDEGRNAELARWGVWYEGLGNAVIDGGNPFGPSASIAPDGMVSQGAPSSLTGYTIVTAENLDAATACAQGCPVLFNGGTVEVYETFNVM